MRRRRLFNAMVVALIFASLKAASAAPVEGVISPSSVDDNGTLRLGSESIPYSDLASPEARRNFVEYTRGFERFTKEPPDLQEERLNQLLMIPGIERLRKAFAVDISPTQIAGVTVSAITPKEGVRPRNENRVLINLHGGGMNGHDQYATLAGQMESIPVASAGSIKVIAINYREAPDWHFPAASEDVAKVYGELLKSYRAENIGIYGCSSGAVLTAEAIAWFQVHGLPRPGAIGLFGSGALEGVYGDGAYFFRLRDDDQGPMTREAEEKSWREALPYYQGVSFEEPLVSPVYSPSVLRQFPPTLLISGTRDIGISPVVYTHSHLVDVGVEADLHVWEGAPHCAYAEPVVDPDVPENRQAWSVITRFFDAHLGRKAR